MKLDNSLFSIAPKTFKPINVHLSGGKSFLMINPKIPVSTELKGIITP